MDVSAAWLEKMKTLPKLEKLKLQGCSRVDDAAVRIWLRFPVCAKST